MKTCYRSLSYKKFRKRQNRKKKCKYEVTGTEKRRSWFIYLKTLKKMYFFGSCYFNFNFFAVFSKMRQTIWTLLVILSIMKFFVAQTSITRFFSSIVVKLNENLIQLSGEPRGQHLGEFFKHCM